MFRDVRFYLSYDQNIRLKVKIHLLMKNIKFTNLERQKTIDNLESEDFDLVVIGGGITGGGIAPVRKHR